MIAVAGLLLLAGPGLAADESVAGLVAPFLKARSDGTLGTVAARAYAEPTRPSAGPAPQPSVSVTLVPYSAALETELDAVKSGLRDSLDGYLQAVARIEEGWQFLAIGSELRMMLDGAATALKPVRGGPGGEVAKY